MRTGALVAFAVTFMVTPLVVSSLRGLRVLDVPNGRSSHTVPTARGGGIAVALGMLVALWFTPSLTGRQGTALLVAAFGFGVIGFVEDVIGIRPLYRFSLQLIPAALALWPLLPNLHGAPAWRLIFGFGVYVWLLAYANAFNFMDGINGISAAQAFVAGGAYFVIGRVGHVPALAAGGAIAAAAGLGFAPYNFPRAVVFLGDLGSYFMGSWIAVLVVFGLRARVTPEAVLAPVALYLADTGTVLVRRVRRGEPWWRPHRTHAYQRLVGLGWSHPDTTLFVTGVMAVCSGIGLLAIGMPLVTRVALDAGIVLTIAGYLAAPSLVARSRSPRAPAPA